MGAVSGHLDWACIFHHREDELLVEQDAVPNREFNHPVQEDIQQANLLGSFAAELIDVKRPSVSFV
jgi:predicted XRE-type DNA-binding protein